jgi:hypothetical protein
VNHGDDLDFWSTAPAEDYSVCGKCFEDDYIKEFIQSSAASTLCDFCGRKGRTRLIAAPLDGVVEFMYQAIDREYKLAADALGWDGAEGGYQGTHWDSRDLLEDEIGLSLPNDDDGRLLDILVECFGDQFWCERDPYALRPDEQLIGSWEKFCDFIKHARRYFFLQQSDKESLGSQEYLTPSELLRFIGETVTEHELVKVLPPGSLIYRARHLQPDKPLSSPYDFGPPSVDKAIRSNRMSPAGIVMFYGSRDAETAIAEIDDDLTLGVAVGTFKFTRQAAILDLTTLPRRFGFFEQQSDSSTVNRYALDFLHNFVKSLAAKVEPGEREHIDYVPTQVVTEWFRTAFRHAGSPLDGILYRSAQRPGGKSAVLFANKHDLVLSPKQVRGVAKAESDDEWYIRSLHENAWLQLVRKRTVRQP